MAIFLHEIIPHMHSIGTPDKYPLYMRKYGGGSVSDLLMPK